jgi:hypothetical protein
MEWGVGYGCGTTMPIGGRQMADVTQNDILMEYYIKNPNRDIAHPEIVDWVTSEYLKRTGKVFRDPDRGVRKLSQQGFLIKVGKGVYRYEPGHVNSRDLEDFTAEQKNVILRRDDYKCVECGKGLKDGVELQVDHIKPKDLGGKAMIENGQILCAQHNYQKKTLNQTQTGKRMFIRLYELAKSEGNEEIKNFCAQVLEVYEKNNVNGHITWER